jgi:hypothetical protein
MENKNIESVEQEDVVNKDQPIIIQPTIIPPRVLLELLIIGVHAVGSDPKKSDAYNTAVKLQEQIDKLRGKEKLMVRILWKTQELNDNFEDEAKSSRQWMIDNASCKYYNFVIAKENFYLSETFIKDKLKAIKEFEKGLKALKDAHIDFKKK